jgi:D-3-phosphoglycerate dehydrogenase
MNVVLSDQIFPDTEIERHMLGDAGHELVVARSRAEADELMVDADAVINGFAELDESAISRMKRAKIIARYGIGIDNIDLVAAARHGMVVTNVPDYCVEEVAAHAVAMALALLRKITTADATVRAGRWGLDEVRPMRRISTLTVGVLGFGRIGRLVANTMRTFGGEILVSDPFLTASPEGVAVVSNDELFRRSDVLFLHAPLTAETQGIVNSETLGQMPEGAIVVNVARGGLIQLDDLFDALRLGRLGGAGIDTFPTEPVDPSLVEGVPGLLVSPHLAYYSEEALRESQVKATTQVIKVLSGESPDYEVTAR